MTSSLTLLLTTPTGKSNGGKAVATGGKTSTTKKSSASSELKKTEATTDTTDTFSSMVAQKFTKKSVIQTHSINSDFSSNIPIQKNVVDISKTAPENKIQNNTFTQSTSSVISADSANNKLASSTSELSPLMTVDIPTVTDSTDAPADTVLQTETATAQASIDDTTVDVATTDTSSGIVKTQQKATPSKSSIKTSEKSHTDKDTQTDAENPTEAASFTASPSLDALAIGAALFTSSTPVTSAVSSNNNTASQISSGTTMEALTNSSITTGALQSAANTSASSLSEPQGFSASDSLIHDSLPPTGLSPVTSGATSTSVSDTHTTSSLPAISSAAVDSNTSPSSASTVSSQNKPTTLAPTAESLLNSPASTTSGQSPATSEDISVSTDRTTASPTNTTEASTSSTTLSDAVKQAASFASSPITQQISVQAQRTSQPSRTTRETTSSSAINLQLAQVFSDEGSSTALHPVSAASPSSSTLSAPDNTPIEQNPSSPALPSSTSASLTSQPTTPLTTAREKQSTATATSSASTPSSSLQARSQTALPEVDAPETSSSASVKTSSEQGVAKNSNKEETEISTRPSLTNLTALTGEPKFGDTLSSMTDPSSTADTAPPTATAKLASTIAANVPDTSSSALNLTVSLQDDQSPVHVMIDRSDDTSALTIHIGTHEQTALNDLQAHKQDLINSLENAGISTAGSQISFSLTDQSSGFGTSQQDTPQHTAQHNNFASGNESSDFANNFGNTLSGNNSGSGGPGNWNTRPSVSATSPLMAATDSVSDVAYSAPATGRVGSVNLTA